MNTPQAFYDQFDRKLVRDFLSGNPRTESAILFAARILKKRNTACILDLGCGIGWSTYEISRACPAALVEGLDLSPNLITLAKALFGETSSRRYECADLTTVDWAESKVGRYDACILLDVYEHIAAACRPAFHSSLAAVLTDNAVVLLTCPTALHQAYLRQERPEGLQPVDEDVRLTELQQLASDISADITHFEHKAIWAENDYFHAILERNPCLKKGVRLAQPHTLIPQRQRRRHVIAADAVLQAGFTSEFRVFHPSWPGRVWRSLRRRLRRPGHGVRS